MSTRKTELITFLVLMLTCTCVSSTRQIRRFVVSLRSCFRLSCLWTLMFMSRLFSLVLTLCLCLCSSKTQTHKWKQPQHKHKHRQKHKKNKPTYKSSAVFTSLDTHLNLWDWWVLIHRLTQKVAIPNAHIAFARIPSKNSAIPIHKYPDFISTMKEDFF